MDYSKSGGGKKSKNAPRFNPKGENPTGKDAQGGKSSKDELLARMKAAAQAKKDDTTPDA